MNIIFVRHGESENNADADFNSLNPKLTKKGKEQARALGKRLKRYNTSERYASKLQRANETGEIISGITRVPIKENLEELTEYRAKHIRSRIKARFNSEHNRKLRKLKRFLRGISRGKNEDKTVLITAHGFTNRVIFSKLLEMPVNRKLFQFSRDNTCMNMLVLDNKHKNWRVQHFNGINHLPENLRGRAC